MSLSKLSTLYLVTRQTTAFCSAIQHAIPPKKQKAGNGIVIVGTVKSVDTRLPGSLYLPMCRIQSEAKKIYIKKDAANAF